MKSLFVVMILASMISLLSAAYSQSQLYKLTVGGCIRSDWQERTKRKREKRI
jgi:hypothetical protein